MDKITGNEPIQPMMLRQTGDNSFRIATEKDIREGIYLSSHTGLTIRQHFACEASVSEESFNKDFIMKFMGVDKIPTDPVENMKFYDAFEAKRKVMKANALIAELNKDLTEQGV